MEYTLLLKTGEACRAKLVKNDLLNERVWIANGEYVFENNVAYAQKERKIKQKMSF